MATYTKQMARELVESLLKEDDGISEKSYDHLCLFMDEMGILEEYRPQLEITDGRFYIAD